MHHIQQKIIDKLRYASTLRYSKMRPDKIESNHYAYHLKELLKDGLIVKTGREYSLSPKGLYHVDRLSSETNKITEQPKIITYLDITNSSGETVLYKKPRQPYIDLLSLPGGKLHIGESLMGAAQREVREKICFQKEITLQHRATAHIIIRQDSIISDVIANIFSGQTNQDIPEEANNVEWVDCTKINEARLLPDVVPIKRLLTTDVFVFEEIEVELRKL